TIVKTCAYIDNLVSGLRGSPPVINVAYSADASFGLIGLRNLGDAAARLLTTEDHVGATLELGGPELVTIRDVARAAGEVLGTEVGLGATNPGAWAAAQAARADSGSDARERRWLTATFDYYDQYGLPGGSTGIPAILGRRAGNVAEVLAEELRSNVNQLCSIANRHTRIRQIVPVQ